MKKIIIALLVLGSLCVNCFAQEVEPVDNSVSDDIRHHEVYVAAGTSSFIGLFSGIFVALGEGIAQAANQNKDNNTSSKDDFAMGFTTGYNYFINPYFGVGGMFTYEKFSSLHLLSLQAKVTGQYGWTHFKFYQSASAGIMFIPGADTPNFIFDIVYLGLKADFDRFNIFVEGAFPATSIVKIGASMKF